MLGRPELARIMQAVRDGLERGGAERVSIANPTEQERRALDELLGRKPSSGKRLGLPLQQLQDTLQRAGLAQDLRTAIQCLGGQLRNRGEERAHRKHAWRAVFDNQSAEATGLNATAWLMALEADGLLKRLADQNPARAETLLRQALGVLQCLPERGKTLSALAADCLGDAHGLDEGQPVATLVKRALCLDAQTASSDELWAAAGVLVGGGISSTVLVLNLNLNPNLDRNLNGHRNGATRSIIQAAADNGEPLYLTLRQLLRDRPAWAPGALPVSICENPAIVAEAANALGRHCAPLICTRGQPSAAVTTCLAQLAAAGARFRYHGDFDWPGIRIANGIINRHSASAWRMGAADYLEAADSGKPLSGMPVTAEWDPELSQAMHARGQVIEEERLLQALLADLDCRVGRP